MAAYYAKRGFPVEQFTDLADHALFSIMLNSEASLRARGMHMKLVPKRGASILRMEQPGRRDVHEILKATDIDPEVGGGGGSGDELDEASSDDEDAYIDSDIEIEWVAQKTK
jgi:hypothetical protein